VAGPCEQLNGTRDFMKDERVTASQGKLSYKVICIIIYQVSLISVLIAIAQKPQMIG
jgi:hypothetical protein